LLYIHLYCYFCPHFREGKLQIVVIIAAIAVLLKFSLKKSPFGLKWIQVGVYPARSRRAAGMITKGKSKKQQLKIVTVKDNKRNTTTTIMLLIKINIPAKKSKLA
jgi:hypothetical protein